MPRPIRATINLAALRENYLLAQRRAAGARAWAVVKANAYGHGLQHAFGALSKVADGFALLDLADAVALRDAGARHPILLLEGVFEMADLPVCAEYGLTPVIHCVEQIQMLRSVALPTRLPVYLKLNSGMNRLGITPAQLPAARYALKDSRSVGEVTLMTHFAEADGGRGIAEQHARFVQMNAGWSCPASLANSAALLRHPQTARDWVRPGIMLYGGSPFADESAASLSLRPVMTLESRIIGVQEVAAGERVGYGGTFVAARPTRVGIVACGYADGYPRHAPGGTPIIVAGERTETVGRVSMDMLACDLSAIPQAGVGSPVQLWGDALPADEVATAAGTISYELFCALAPRVPVTAR